MEKIIDFPHQRGLLAKAMIEGLRTYCRAYFHSETLDDHLPDIVIVLAIITGQAEEKPLTASDIAAYTGLPRATVIRRIRKMVATGFAGYGSDGRRQPVYNMHVNNPEVVEEIVKLLGRIKRLNDEVSKMDGKPLADQKKCM